MATIITFENDLEKEVAIEQVSTLNKYIKVTSIDGLVKKKEEFDGDKISYLIYYLANDESVSNILNIYAHIPIIETRVRTYVEEYIVENDEEYRNGHLEFKGKTVLDKNGNIIFSSPIDAITNKADNVETNKYYYDLANNKLYTFWYGDNGELSNMDSLNPIHKSYINEFKQSFLPEELPDLEGLDWANMTYYYHVEPAVPANFPIH